MTVRVRLVSRARRHANRITTWWREKRPAAPDLFETELSETLELLRTAPRMGRPYGWRRDQLIRRIILPNTAHHVYYVYDEAHDEIVVIAIWSGHRGRGPALS